MAWRTSNWRWSRSCSANGRPQNPRATFKTPITAEDVLNSRMIAYPFRLLQCCLVTDGGGALILVAAERAKDFPQKPVYLLGTGDSVETPMVSQMEDFPPRARSRRRPPRLCRGRYHAQRPRPPDDGTMPFASADLRPRRSRLCAARRGRAFIAERNTAPGGRLPLNANGGGLSYMHSGMYGMYVLQESVRQMRGTAPRPNPRRPDLGLPRRRRHVRRLRHDHNVE
jgi:acetyl-CoA acetyltransferase